MPETPEFPKKEPPPMRGLYGKVNIPVKTLDKIIIGGIIAIVLVILLGLQNRGYTVSFDTLGGTPVEPQSHMYGELVDPPADPTREGFLFAGWYQDANHLYPWDLAKDTVKESMVLYADWSEK